MTNSYRQPVQTHVRNRAEVHELNMPVSQVRSVAPLDQAFPQEKSWERGRNPFNVIPLFFPKNVLMWLPPELIRFARVLYLSMQISVDIAMGIKF